MRGSHRTGWVCGLAAGAGVTAVAWVGWGNGPPSESAPPPDENTWPVVGVVDADTFVVLYHGVGTTIRLAEVDAPEGPRDVGGKAMAAMLKLIDGRYVALDPVDPTGRARDRLGRLVSRVRVDGKDVGTELLRQGVAERIEDASDVPDAPEVEHRPESLE